VNFVLGNMDWKILLLVILGVWIIQSGMTILQVKNYQKALRDLIDSRSGDFIGVGSKKGMFQPGTVIVMAVDKLGSITKIKKMEGLTVFSRFRLWDHLNGYSIYELDKDIFPAIKISKTCKKAVKKAASLIIEKISAVSESDLQIKS